MCKIFFYIKINIQIAQKHTIVNKKRKGQKTSIFSKKQSRFFRTSSVEKLRKMLKNEKYKKKNIEALFIDCKAYAWQEVYGVI